MPSDHIQTASEKDNGKSIEEQCLPSSGSGSGLRAGIPERQETERRLVQKLDSRLLPTIVLIYIMNYIDRSSITAARLKGMQDDLHISDTQYDTVLAMLYVTYCTAQLPSNMLLNYLTRPSLYIGFCVVFWGLASTLTGSTTNYSGMLLCRTFIGMPEAAFYPGAVYLLSRWYTKKELALRSALLYSGLIMASAFGSLMAAGILSQMEGKRNIRAWRWLFYIEGSITIFIGLAAMWLLPDYPGNTRWLSDQESRVAQARLAEDAGEADKDDLKDSPFEGLRMAMKDPLVYIFAVQTVLQLIGLSFSSFFPTLTGTLGFSTTITLVLAAPPWIFAAVACSLSALHADRTGERFLHLAGWLGVVIVGLMLGLSSMSVPARYVAFFLMISGHAGYALNLVWVSNAIPRPPAKRAAAIGFVNGVGNLGNLIGSYTWKSTWSPGYHPSMIISLCALVISTSLQFGIRQMLIRKNKRLAAEEDTVLEAAERTRIEEAAMLQGISFDQALKKRKGFRYLY